MKKSTRSWLRGLIGANISGGAGALASSSAITLIAPETFNAQHIGKVIALLVVTFLAHAVIGGAMYLKDSPLPKDDA